MDSFPNSFNYKDIKERIAEQASIEQYELLCKSRERFMKTVDLCIETFVSMVFFKISDTLTAESKSILIDEIAAIFPKVQCKVIGIEKLLIYSEDEPKDIDFENCIAIYIDLNE